LRQFGQRSFNFQRYLAALQPMAILLKRKGIAR
jgi:hypothetical protein